MTRPKLICCFDFSHFSVSSFACSTSSFISLAARHSHFDIRQESNAKSFLFFLLPPKDQTHPS